jgi:hypothetical protein
MKLTLKEWLKFKMYRDCRKTLPKFLLYTVNNFEDLLYIRLNRSIGQIIHNDLSERMRHEKSR